MKGTRQLLHWCLSMLAAAAIVLAPSTASALTFDFTFEAGTPSELETAVNHAGDLWESWLTNTASGESEDVELTISYESLRFAAIRCDLLWGPTSGSQCATPSGRTPVVPF